MSSRMRVTKGHRNNRRAHHSADTPTVVVDEKTKSPHIRHRVDPATGMYRGRQVLKVKPAAPKKEEEKTTEKAETKEATKKSAPKAAKKEKKVEEKK